jgi:hypothetical protein
MYIVSRFISGPLPNRLDGDDDPLAADGSVDATVVGPTRRTWLGL